MVATFLATTGVNDINPGSVLSTFLEAAAGEDAQQFFQMFQIIRNYNLDTTEADDLDIRAAEFGLSRLAAQRATGLVTISDAAITPVKTKIYAGNRGPVAGQTSVDVDDATLFTSSGTIIIGRDTNNAETVTYSSITNFGNFFRLNLTGGVTHDHGVDEIVTLSQGGDRTIAAGTVVRVPASDVSDEISFVLTNTVVILDGDSQAADTPIIAINTGTVANAPANTIIEFDSKPFVTAVVTNSFSITDGSDRENDADLRNRIKDTVQSLSRGVKKALLSGVAGIFSLEDNKRVVSANLIEPVTLDDIAFLFIDDGTGLEPTTEGTGNEVQLAVATGNEEFLQLGLFPIVKAEVETQNSQPFAVISGDTLTIAVNDIEQTITFGPNDFTIEGALTAYEIARAINDRVSLVEARTTNGGTRVILRAKSLINEKIRIIGGTANTANKLNFSTDTHETIFLYKFNGDELTLLNKDGNFASLENSTDGSFSLFGGETLTFVIDGKTANPQTVTFQAGDFLILGSATAAEVAIRINLELTGAVAIATSIGQRVTITSNSGRSSTSKIHVTGGTANAGILNFSTDEISGIDKGFSLNRFNGQIELASPAVAGELYETASTKTRGFLVSTNVEPYTLTNGDTIVFSIDGGSSKTVTFLAADFINILTATAAEIVSIINTNVVGAHAEVTSDNRVLVRTNTWDPSIGSIEITSVTGTATALGFEVGTIFSSTLNHVPAVISGNSENYTFAEGQKLVVVIDKAPTINTFNISFDLPGTVTIGSTGPFDNFIGDISAISQNFRLKFPNTGDLVDFTIKWLTGANAGDTSIVSAYDGDTGEFTLTSALTFAISVSDTFTIIPVTAKNVATYLSNTAVSSLPNKATVEPVDDGTRIQITSQTVGSMGAVQVTGGTANSVLGFSSTQVEGVDGYKHYTGILRKVQFTVDGLDTDFATFPGLRAAGVQIEVLPAIVRLLSFEFELVLKGGVTAAIIHDKVVNAVSGYVNSLGVGNDVILNDMVKRLMEIDGVLDVAFTDPTANIAIADNEIARVSDNAIFFG